MGTVDELTSRLKMGLEMEPQLIRVQKKASFAAVVTGCAGDNAGTATILKKMKEVIKPRETGIRLESVREGTGGRIIVKC